MKNFNREFDLKISADVELLPRKQLETITEKMKYREVESRLRFMVKKYMWSVKEYFANEADELLKQPYSCHHCCCCCCGEKNHES